MGEVLAVSNGAILRFFWGAEEAVVSSVVATRVSSELVVWVGISQDSEECLSTR